MKVSRIMWYAGTVFTTLAMLAASTTAVAQRKDADQRARQEPQRTNRRETNRRETNRGTS